MGHAGRVLFDGGARPHVVLLIHDVVGGLLVIGGRHHDVPVVRYIFIDVKFWFT